MSLSFSIKFFLNERPPRDDGKRTIYARVRINRKKSECSLSMAVEKVKWDEQRGRIKATTKHDRYQNNRLNNLENKISEIYYELEHAKKPISAKIVTDIFKGAVSADDITLLNFFITFINELEGKGEVVPAVIQHYKQCQDKVMLYLESINDKDMLLRNFKRANIDGFENFLLRSVIPGRGTKLMRSTVSGRLKKLRAVIRNAVLKQLINENENPFRGFRIKMAKSNPVHLTRQEIKKLMEHPLAGNESLKRVRDLYIFSCYSGLRYGDIISLTEKNIVEDSGRLFIIKDQNKTGQAVEIPMLGPCEKIYRANEAHRKLTGFCFRKISNQKINSFLSVIGQMVNIEKRLTFHSSRHTYAVSILLESGFADIHTTSYLLGHTSLRTTSDSYARITRKNLTNVANKLDEGL